MIEWLAETRWLGNSALAWVVAGASAIVAYAVLHLLVKVVARRLRTAAQHPRREALAVLADVVGATRGWLILLLALAFAARALDFPPPWGERTLQVIELALAIQVALWLSQLVVNALNHASDRGHLPRQSVMSGLLGWSAQLIIWSVLLLGVLSNMGVNVNAFIASLGVGGIAVALAAQNILGDLFSSVSIGLDKPFEVGDFIAFGGGEWGTVKRVGIKSTRIQALSGEEIAISNTKLLQDLLRNFNRMTERRVAFQFGVPLTTPRASVERLVGEVKALISAMDGVRLGRGHLTGFGESSLDLEFVYFVLDPGFDAYRDIQQKINFAILELLERLGAQLAVPVRAVHAGDATGDVVDAAAAD